MCRAGTPYIFRDRKLGPAIREPDEPFPEREGAPEGCGVVYIPTFKESARSAEHQLPIVIQLYY